MKKILVVSMVVFILVACGDKSTTQTDTAPQTSGGSEPVVDYSHINKAEVQAYVDRISDVVQKMPTVNTNDLTAMHDWSKVVDKLKQEGLQFGENLFSEPYGRCAILGIDAQDYWQQLRDNDKLGIAKEVLQRFYDNKKACEEILDNLP